LFADRAYLRGIRVVPLGSKPEHRLTIRQALEHHGLPLTHHCL